MADVPIACSLDPAALASRRTGLLRELVGQAASRSELPSGHRLTFAASTVALELIAAVIDAERQCCRFLTFQLTVPPDGATFVLDLTGPADTREFVTALLNEP